MDFATASHAAAKAFVAEKLANEKTSLIDGELGWTLRGLLAIYANQTRDEQASETTNVDNGIGFTGTDAKFLSSMAKNVQDWKDGKSDYKWPLSKKQWESTHEAMLKYAGQLAKIAKAKKLEEQRQTAC